jgi:hypothetical protein
MMSRAPARQSGRSVGPFIAFLALFLILLLAVSHWYLLPALDASNHADARGRRLLGLHALLLMSLLLIILILFLVILFRMSRYFFPGPSRPRIKTKYVDAWTEAGKRMQPPPKQ